MRSGQWRRPRQYLVERVRLTKDTDVEEETVSGQVRKERVETDGLTDDERS